MQLFSLPLHFGKRKLSSSSFPSKRILITGGQGFLGTYIIKKLLQFQKEGRIESIVSLDLQQDNSIWDQVLLSQEIKSFKLAQNQENFAKGNFRILGDVSNFETVYNSINSYNPSHIIHLAALQVPSCRNDPLKGAMVNVIGTLNIFETVKKLQQENKMNNYSKDKTSKIVYASSAAVAGFSTDYESPIVDSTPHWPRTHYGVFKIANEGNARIYWQDHSIYSIGLRPHTIYGVGREVGITSGPSKAIKASVLSRPYQISFSGKTSFAYVEDVADIFVACCSVPHEVMKTDLSQLEEKKHVVNNGGAYSLNIRGTILGVEEFVSILHTQFPISKGLISIKSGATSLPLAFNFEQKGLDHLLNKANISVSSTSIQVGISKTMQMFQKLHQQGMLHDRDLSS